VEHAAEAGTPQYRLIVTEPVKFDGERLLDEYAFSLTKVYRYGVPARHFRLPYLSLSEFDFKTIATGRVFWSRTATGLLLNALPQERVYELREAILRARFARGFGGEVLSVAWSIVRDYVTEEYAELPALFNGIMAHLRDVEGLEDVAGRVAIGDPSDGIDPIERQAKLFTQMSAAWTHEEIPILRALDVQVSQNRASEEAFLREFRWQLLPIENF
jgi:hypothetical protein